MPPQNKKIKSKEQRLIRKGKVIPPTLGVAIMVKNESKRIKVTLESIKNICNPVIILDTGSTDGTQEIIREYCKNNDLQLHLIEAPFVDFSVSRNVLLDFADDKADYILMLDCNDELRKGEELRKFVTEYRGNCTGFFMTQNWWSGLSLDTYLNVRLVKTKFQWRYREPIHEYIMSPDAEKNPNLVSRELAEKVILFQDRTLDDDKSQKRFSKDRAILYKDQVEHFYKPRTNFYLAQTLSCLQQAHLSYRYYKRRTFLGDFPEEIYHAYYHCGEIGEALGHEWDASFLMYKKSIETMRRCEPYLKIAGHFMHEGIKYAKDGDMIKSKISYETAYMWAKESCKLEIPMNILLFLNKRAYSFDRFIIMGMICLELSKIDTGKKEKYLKDGKEQLLRITDSKDLESTNVKELMKQYE